MRPGDEGRLRHGGSSDDDLRDAGLDRRAHGGQDPAHGVEGAVEPQLADEHGAGEGLDAPAREVAPGTEDREREGRVEAGAGLGQVGRREVDGHAALAPGHAARGQRGSDPFA